MSIDISPAAVERVAEHLETFKRCPFDDPKCSIEPDQPCPVCGDTADAANDRSREPACVGGPRQKDVAAMLRALSARCAALEQDAARYRWLRNDSKFAGPKYRYGDMVWPVIGVDAHTCEPCFDKELDAAVDAAMRGE